MEFIDSLTRQLASASNLFGVVIVSREAITRKLECEPDYGTTWFASLTEVTEHATNAPAAEVWTLRMERYILLLLCCRVLSKIRSSAGPYFVAFPNLREALVNHVPIRTQARSCTILPNFVGCAASHLIIYFSNVLDRTAFGFWCTMGRTMCQSQ